MKTIGICALVVLACLKVVQLPAEPRFALVVGNGHYAQLAPLKNPAKDAADMAFTLRQLGFSVTLLTDASQQQMDDGIIQLGTRLAADRSSVGFFYYAGHGVQSQGENYLIPADVNIPGEAFLPARALAIQTVLSTLGQSGNGLNVIVLDACRNNPFSWTRGGGRGLTVVAQQHAGSIVAYSAGAGQVALDGDGDNGVYTGALLKILRKPGLDIYDVLRQTGADVSSTTNHAQEPAIYSQYYGQTYLAGQPASSDVAPQGTRPLVVWRVGSPWGNSLKPSDQIDPAILSELEKFGERAEFRSFTAVTFPQAFFKAVDTGEEPDILVFNNYMILEGGKTDNGSLVGITSRPGISQQLVRVSESLEGLNFDRGWEFLLTGAKNYPRAMAFAMREPQVELTIRGSIGASPRADVVAVEQLSRAATLAYVSGQRADLSALSDPDRIGNGVLFSKATTVRKVLLASMEGNSRIVFVQTKCTFEQAGYLGTKTIAVVAHNVQNQWRALSITDDPLALSQIHAASSIVDKLSDSSSVTAVAPAQILTAEGLYPLPASGERFGSFQWRSSSTSGLLSEVVEFDYQTATRLFIQIPKPGSIAALSTGQLWHVPGLWSWRIWSIDRWGNLAFSRTNHFRNDQ